MSIDKWKKIVESYEGSTDINDLVKRDQIKYNNEEARFNFPTDYTPIRTIADLLQSLDQYVSTRKSAIDDPAAKLLISKINNWYPGKVAKELDRVSVIANPVHEAKTPYIKKSKDAIVKPKFNTMDASSVNKSVRNINLGPEAGRYISNLRANNDEISDEQAIQNSTYGIDLPRTSENLPVVIRSELVKFGENFDPKWIMVKHLPGYIRNAIRSVGRQLFQQFTDTPVEDIQCLSTLTHSTTDVQRMMHFITKNGVEDSKATIDFSRSMPGYTADTSLWKMAGYEFLLVKDFAGYYIYGWTIKHPDTLTEGEHSVLYHSLSFRYANIALKNNELLATTCHRLWKGYPIIRPSDPRYTDFKNSYSVYGISLTRDKNFAMDWNVVTFVFDKTKLSNRYKIIPINWHASVPDVSPKTEFEEFVVVKKEDDDNSDINLDSSKLSIKNLSSYLIGIYVDSNTIKFESVLEFFKSFPSFKGTYKDLRRANF